MSTEITERVRPFETEIALLDGIPGVAVARPKSWSLRSGWTCSRFPSAAHLASWAGMCPGNNESAGKRKSGKTRKGSPWLRSALVEAAHGAGRTKNTYLGAQFRRLLPRRGKKRAAVAVGHSILTIAYHVLTTGDSSTDLGVNYFDKRDCEAAGRRLVRRLNALGCDVDLHPRDAPAA